MSQLNNIEVSVAMLEEENRYCSFPEEWERLHPDLPSRQQLAKAGFFHERIESAVGTLHWRRGEDVDKEHQRINPSCSFYNSQSNAIVSNVYIP
ncbi:hypothetical protein B566_EDAN007748 [Ephemera danica]|nr:hypothetical protein B566_EDAN007748 [Ephemera danica]